MFIRMVILLVKVGIFLNSKLIMTEKICKYGFPTVNIFPRTFNSLIFSSIVAVNSFSHDACLSLHQQYLNFFHFLKKLNHHYYVTGESKDKLSDLSKIEDQGHAMLYVEVLRCLNFMIPCFGTMVVSISAPKHKTKQLYSFVTFCINFGSCLLLVS